MRKTKRPFKKLEFLVTFGAMPKVTRLDEYKCLKCRISIYKKRIKYIMGKDLEELKDKDGNLLSPVLSDDVKNYLIDIDGTICDDIPNEEPERMVTAEVYPDALETLNKWYDEGHIITFFTSRTESHREVTETWLDKHGFKYQGLLMGKPRGGNYHWIDNHMVKATRFKGKFTDLILANKKIEVFED